MPTFNRPPYRDWDSKTYLYASRVAGQIEPSGLLEALELYKSKGDDMPLYSEEQLSHASRDLLYGKPGTKPDKQTLKVLSWATKTATNSIFWLYDGSLLTDDDRSEFLAAAFYMHWLLDL